MKISVFASDANPAIDKRLLRRSRSFCEQEVAEGRAKLIGADVTQGIQLFPSTKDMPGQHKSEGRGSSECRGPLTAHEAQIAADYRGSETDVSLLSREYEHRLEQHILNGKKGTPRACEVIAARVKTILSNPALSPS